MIKFLLPTLVLICFSFSVTSMAKELGVFGAVYDITEKDALKEIEEKAREVDINRIIRRGDLARKVSIPPTSNTQSVFIRTVSNSSSPGALTLKECSILCQS